MAAKVLNETIGTFKIDKLLADPRDIYVTTDEQIAADADLKRGQLVEYDTATNKVKALTVTAPSGEGAKSTYGDVFGIVQQDASGASGDVFVPVYVHGAFNYDEVAAVNADVDLEDLYAPLRKIGLILRRPEAAKE